MSFEDFVRERFPYDKSKFREGPNRIQQEMMPRIVSAIQNGRSIVIQAPFGLGKNAWLLAASHIFR